jgi:hypothetical protein
VTRDFWIAANDLEMPGKVVSLYPQVQPPNEPGVWVRVEVSILPGQRVERVNAKVA